jgi:two-component system sensor histidine kinase DegS
MEAAQAGAEPLAGRFDGPRVEPVALLPSDVAQLAAVRAEAQDRERARLARDIHDGPAQALANAVFAVERVERLLEVDPQAAPAELAALRERLHRELASVRALIGNLRPPVLDELGLDRALRDVASEASQLTGLEVVADLTAPADLLDGAQQAVVLRVAQEALQNIHKHAAASAVSVATAIRDGAWVLEVRDDGRGFAAAGGAARGRRLGLQIMRERAEIIGSRLDMRSRPDEGTIVRLAIPMRGQETT